MNNELDRTGSEYTSGGPDAAPHSETPASPESGPAQTAAPSAAPEASAYPNVGSSGANTANTARTDYSSPAGSQPGGYAQNGYAQGGAPNSGPAGAPQGGSQPYGSQNGYTRHAAYQYNTPHTGPYDYSQPAGNAGGYTGGYTGGSGYNGYSYASAPQQPPKKHRFDGKKLGKRILAGVLCAALGFGGGLAGVVVASRTGLIGGQVVVQQVQRELDTQAASQGSAGGSTLTLQDVAAIVQPSVVVITTEQMVSSNTWFGGSYLQSGAGSGVIISEDGYILTCAHVVSGANTITVQLNDGTEYTANVVGGDSSADIAVLKVDASGLTPAVLGNSDALAVGEDVIAVGNPMGTLGGTVTNGIVSALNREIKVQNNKMTLIQTNAAISPGNSGGGLFNGAGELIGIVNAKSGSISNGTATNAEGLGFAIPINTAMSVAQELIDNGYVKRPVLGISVVTLDASGASQYGLNGAGVYITQVNPGSGAEKAGLKTYDRILSVDDVTVNQSTDVTDYLKDKAVGDTVKLQIDREGRLMSVDVTLGESSMN